MTPQKQAFRHRPDEGQIGDCWRTTLACLLDLQRDDVPHLLHDCWEDHDEARRRTHEWLATQGLTLVEIPYNGDLQLVLDLQGSMNPGIHYLLGGTSRNGVNHSVIACDDAIVWDPAIDDSGIVGPMSDGCYWLSWLVPLVLRKAA